MNQALSTLVDSPTSTSSLLAAALVVSLLALFGTLALLRSQRWRAGQLAQALTDAQARLGELQDRDPVTGALTRAGFAHALAAAVTAADAQRKPLCVLVFGLDHFRTVNDAYGMALGDEVLRRVHARLAERQPGVPLARLGGDEFALLVTLDLAASRALCVRLLKALDEPLVCQNQELRMGASVGVAAYPEHGGQSLLLPNARAAMGAAKRAGGGLHAEYEPAMGADLRLHAELMHDLRRAIERRQLELVYQPKVDAHTLQVTAAEALLRWHHPERGLVSPQLFVPLAERHGLMTTIGLWVLEEACRQAAQWRAQGLRMRVAINVSGVQLRQDDLAPQLHAALQRHGLHPERFTVELTETAAMENTTVTRRAIARLGQLGVHMSIDDFGVGESSLASLRRLPAAELKVDRAFITDLETRSDARCIVQAIVQMAHSLEMRVVAEGVETVAQRDLLVSMGCDELQGYLFARPMSASALSLLAAESFAATEGPPQFSASLFGETAPAPLADEAPGPGAPPVTVVPTMRA